MRREPTPPASVHHSRWTSRSCSAASTEGLTASMALGLIPAGGSLGLPSSIGLASMMAIQVHAPTARRAMECTLTPGYNSFTCNCGNGRNTSTNCHFASASWNSGSMTVLLWIGIGLISSLWPVVAGILQEFRTEEYPERTTSWI